MASCANAQEAIEHCVKYFLNDYFSTPETWSVKSSGEKVLTAVNNCLFSNGNKGHVNSMVTTLSAVFFKSTTAHIFHIGDSSINRSRQGSYTVDLELITTDCRVWQLISTFILATSLGWLLCFFA